MERAVDPRKIPYSSKVVFAVTDCVAVDKGTGCVQLQSCAVVSTEVDRNAIIIDRFFSPK
jgi:hypothetical protein